MDSGGDDGNFGDGRDDGNSNDRPARDDVVVLVVMR